MRLTVAVCSIRIFCITDCDAGLYPVKRQQIKVDINWTSETIKMKGDVINFLGSVLLDW